MSINNRTIKAWTVNLYGLDVSTPRSGSVISEILSQQRTDPFVVGFSKSKPDMNKLNGEFIELYCDLNSFETRAVRASLVGDMRCFPIYAEDNNAHEDIAKADSDEVCSKNKLKSFEAASMPLIKWLAENAHPHHVAIVSSGHAELLESKLGFPTEEFIKG
jgi:hypothetical protein